MKYRISGQSQISWRRRIS